LTSCVGEDEDPPMNDVSERLEDQLAWYDAKATRNRLWFQSLKVLQIVIAASIPVVAAADVSVAVAGALGAIIVVMEGLQQLFQFQQNWVSFRGTAEALKRENYLFLAGVGPYQDAQRREALLAQRVEDLVATEHAAWSAAQKEPAEST
jgi:hypothetical protein